MLATAIIVFREVLEAALIVGIVMAASRGVMRRGAWWNANYYVMEHDEYRTPPRDDLELTDDVLADKHPAFDDKLVDSRPVGDWELNASATSSRATWNPSDCTAPPQTSRKQAPTTHRPPNESRPP